MTTTVEDLDPELQSALQSLVVAFRRRRPRRFERGIRENLVAFALLQPACDGWNDLAGLLTTSGVRTPDGGVIRAEVLRTQVGRARRAAASGAGRRSAGNTPPAANAVLRPGVREHQRGPAADGISTGRQIGGRAELHRQIADLFESEE